MTQQHAAEFEDLKRLQYCLDHLLLSCKNLHEEISVIRQDFQTMLTLTSVPRPNDFSDKNADNDFNLFESSVLEDILYDGISEFFPPEEFFFKIRYHKRNNIVKETPQYFIV